MTRVLRLHAALSLLCLAFLALAVYLAPRCECVLGAHYVDPLDPSDCAVHGERYEQ